MRTSLRRRLTATVVSGSLLAGTLAAAPIAHAAVPVDEAGLANALFGSTMRIVNRDDDLAKNLVASAELLDWRARNTAAAPAAVTAHLAAVRKHIEAAVPNQAWSREPAETVSAALAAVRNAPGTTVNGPKLSKLNNTLLGLDTVPISTKPEDRVSGFQQQAAWEAGFADNQTEVWSGVAQTARADAGFKVAWNTEIGDVSGVNSGGGSIEFGQGVLRTVLDVSRLQNAAKLGQVELRKEVDAQYGGLANRLHADRKTAVDRLKEIPAYTPPDAKPTEPTEAQKTAAKAEEEKRKGYIDAGKAGLDGLAWVAGLIDKDFAKRITKFAEGAVKVAYALNKVWTGFTLINSAFSMATAAFTGNIVGAISTLISVFTAGPPSIEQQIFEQIVAMRKQLEEVRQQMHDRFDKVDAKLDNMYNRMLDEFAKLENGVTWVRENQKQMLESLTSLSLELQVVGTTLLKAITGLYKLDKWGKIDLYVDYKRKHNNRDLPEADFIKAESDFWVTAVQAPTNDLFVVPQANHRTDSPTVLTNLNLHGDGGTAAFLAYYAKAALDGNFTHTGHGGNPSAWGIGATAYGLLLKQNPQWLTGTDTRERSKLVLKEGKDIRDQLLAFSQPGPNGETNKIFQTLLANYGVRADQVMAEVLKREGEVSEGKQLALFRGPEQGAPAVPGLLAPVNFEDCTPNPDPALNIKVSRAKNHDGLHQTPGTLFWRYFRPDTLDYKPCAEYEVRGVPGQPSAHDLIIRMEDKFFWKDGSGSIHGGQRTVAPVHRWTNGAPRPHEVVAFINGEWDRSLKAIFERDGKKDGPAGDSLFLTKGNELLKAKRIDFYQRAANYVRTSNEAKELNLAARLLRAYTEAGFPRALGTDEFLRSVLYGPKPLYGSGESDNEYLAQEFLRSAGNLAENKPAWDNARSDVSPPVCLTFASVSGTDPTRGCLRENMKSRQDRLTARLAEQFRLRWEGADQTLPGLQTQLRTLYVTLRSVHPDFDFGPPIEAPPPIAPAAAIWKESEAVDGAAAKENGVATTMFKGRQFVAWRGTDGYLYGSLHDGKQWAPKSRILDTPMHASFSPSVAEFNGKLVLVWKYKEFNQPFVTQVTASSADGRTWTNSAVFAHRALQNVDSPALTVFNGKLHALYRSPDNKMYLGTSTDGVNWSGFTHTLVGNLTNQRPGMTVHNGKLYVAWRGHDEHPRAYLASSVDGVTWVGAESRVGGNDVGIDGGPVLASHGGKLYAVWRGVGGDEKLYGSFTSDDKQWSPQFYVARGVRTNFAPSLTLHGGRLRLAWGPPADVFQGNTVAAASSAVLPG